MAERAAGAAGMDRKVEAREERSTRFSDADIDGRGVCLRQVCPQGTLPVHRGDQMLYGTMEGRHSFPLALMIEGKVVCG